MPALENYLHYRMIDVSSIKELAGWWYGINHRKPNGAQHTALWDTRQSIAELKYYREKVFKPDGESGN
jgi:oligoribonuclease